MGHTDKYSNESGAPALDSDVTTPMAPAVEQAPDSPGKDENGDGVTGGQTTADTVGDVLGV